MICIINDKEQKEEISRKILSKLPEWFGLHESTEEYIKHSKDMPFWAHMNGIHVRFMLCLFSEFQFKVWYVVIIIKLIFSN